MSPLRPLLVLCVLLASVASGGELRRLPRNDLLDRLRGGWAGQLIGNIQGLPFEFKYKDAPGPLPAFVPLLPRARSDDDTDIEWTHLHAMDRLGVLLVPYPELAREWVRSVNRGIWVANERARKLMATGVVPPWTSHPALNPHAVYNLSGQFCAETYGFLAPGLPQAAGRLGLHYTRVTVRGEPLQACAFTTALVSLAFFERDVPRLVARSLAAVDPESQHAEMVRDVLAWHREWPADWRATRAAIQRKHRDERKWNMNATVTNGAFVVAALLYGKGDFAETLRLAFALGYDADCNAATCGAVLGVLHGAQALAAHRGWVLPAHYDNGTRDGLPKTQTMEELVALTAGLAEKAIRDAGGRVEGDGAQAACLIPMQEPAVLERVRESLPTEDAAAVEEAVDQEAMHRLSDASAAARSFAALRLAHHRWDRLGAAERERVRTVLDATLKDDVLAPLARSALDKINHPAAVTPASCWQSRGHPARGAGGGTPPILPPGRRRYGAPAWERGAEERGRGQGRHGQRAVARAKGDRSPRKGTCPRAACHPPAGSEPAGGSVGCVGQTFSQSLSHW